MVRDLANNKFPNSWKEGISMPTRKLVILYKDLISQFREMLHFLCHYFLVEFVVENNS